MERRGDEGAPGGALAICCNRVASSHVTTGRLDTTTAILCVEGSRDGDVDDGDDGVAGSRTGDSRIGDSWTGEGSRAGGEGSRIKCGSLKRRGFLAGTDPWAAGSRVGDCETGDCRNGDRTRGGGREWNNKSWISGLEGTGDGDCLLTTVVDEVAVPIVGTSGRGGGVGVGVGLSRVSTTSSGLSINCSNPCFNSPTSSLISGEAWVSDSNSARSFSSLIVVPNSILSLARVPLLEVANSV